MQHPPTIQSYDLAPTAAGEERARACAPRAAAPDQEDVEQARHEDRAEQVEQEAGAGAQAEDAGRDAEEEGSEGVDG